MRKIIVSVAPVSALDTQNNPGEIARDVYECYKAGAGMVHLHCRDRQGKLTEDTAVLQETVQLIKEKCPIVIEVSTGGVSNLSIQQRCAPCYPAWVECNSLNVGSVNLGEAVYINPIADVRYCVGQILQNKKMPEVEVFEIGMINTTRQLVQAYPFARPVFFAIVLGHAGAMPATVPALDLMLQGLTDNFPNKDEVLWGITHAHRKSWALVEAALDRGAKAVRIGFEDSSWLDETHKAETNAPIVERCVQVMRQKNTVPASPDEVRNMLNIQFA